MIINVVQPDNGLASQRVEIFANNKVKGCVGPGETLTVDSPEPCIITAKCGFYCESTAVDRNVTLTIRWSSSPPSMELTCPK